MALSGAERLYVFEILDVPPNATGFELWGTLGESNAVQSFAFTTAKDAVDALIALLTADQETIVKALVEEWIKVRTSEVELNRAEEVEGVVQDAAAKRRNIRDRLQVHIPIYREGELVRRHGQFGGYGNQIMRG